MSTMNSPLNVQLYTNIQLESSCNYSLFSIISRLRLAIQVLCRPVMMSAVILDHVWLIWQKKYGRISANCP